MKRSLTLIPFVAALAGASSAHAADQIVVEPVAGAQEVTLTAKAQEVERRSARQSRVLARVRQQIKVAAARPSSAARVQQLRRQAQRISMSLRASTKRARVLRDKAQDLQGEATAPEMVLVTVRSATSLDEKIAFGSCAGSCAGCACGALGGPPAWRADKARPAREDQG